MFYTYREPCHSICVVSAMNIINSVQKLYRDCQYIVSDKRTLRIVNRELGTCKKENTYIS